MMLLLEDLNRYECWNNVKIATSEEIATKCEEIDEEFIQSKQYWSYLLKKFKVVIPPNPKIPRADQIDDW